MFQRQTNTSHVNENARIKTMMDYLEELADTPTLSEDMGEIDVILMEEL